MRRTDWPTGQHPSGRGSDRTTPDSRCPGRRPARRSGGRSDRCKVVESGPTRSHPRPPASGPLGAGRRRRDNPAHHSTLSAHRLSLIDVGSDVLQRSGSARRTSPVSARAPSRRPRVHHYPTPFERAVPAATVRPDADDSADGIDPTVPDAPQSSRHDRGSIRVHGRRQRLDQHRDRTPVMRRMHFRVTGVNDERGEISARVSSPPGAWPGRHLVLRRRIRPAHPSQSCRGR